MNLDNDMNAGVNGNFYFLFNLQHDPTLTQGNFSILCTKFSA